MENRRIAGQAEKSHAPAWNAQSGVRMRRPARTAIVAADGAMRLVAASAAAALPPAPV